LDELATLLNATLRIKDSPEMAEVAKSLALRIQGDANINCVMTAATCMEALAKGMQGAFARYRETVVGPMLERLKERKANVTDSIGDALDAVFASVRCCTCLPVNFIQRICQTTLPDIIPDLGPAFNSKNPQVKEGTLKFLGRCLATASSPIQPAQIKPLGETLTVLLEDGFEGARNEAATCLGILMKMVGERPLNPVIDGLPEMRKVKVREAYERATVKCKAGAAPPPKAAPPPVAAPPPAKKKAPAPAAKPAVAEDEEPPKKPASKPPAKPPVCRPLPCRAVLTSHLTGKKTTCSSRSYLSSSQKATCIHELQAIQSSAIRASCS
jgi:cytoskeleton-associated protein 5